MGPNARYLATVGRVKPAHRETFAAATLAGDLVRVHTVDRDENPLYWKLLHAAGKATGLPVLYNTSFNLFGEPLVCTPRDAVRSFYSSGIEAMFVGNFFLQKVSRQVCGRPQTDAVLSYRFRRRRLRPGRGSGRRAPEPTGSRVLRR